MTDQDFDFIRKLLRDRSAITLEDGKQYLVESRLAPLLRELKLDSIGDLVALLRSPLSNGLQQQVVEAMVTTETTFFRDLHPFEALRKSLIPELVRKRQNERCLNIWCAACSTGQEPYSVALLIREHFPEPGVLEGQYPGDRPLAGRPGPRGRGVTARSRSTAVCPRRSW